MYSFEQRTKTNAILAMSCASEVDEPGTYHRGLGGPEVGPGPDYIAYVFVSIGSVITCRFFKLNLPDQAQFTSPLGVSLSDLV
jgi:hypothetical protein